MNEVRRVTPNAGAPVQRRAGFEIRATTGQGVPQRTANILAAYYLATQIEKKCKDDPAYTFSAEGMQMSACLDSLGRSFGQEDLSGLLAAKGPMGMLNSITGSPAKSKALLDQYMLGDIKVTTSSNQIVWMSIAVSSKTLQSGNASSLSARPAQTRPQAPAADDSVYLSDGGLKQEIYDTLPDDKTEVTGSVYEDNFVSPDPQDQVEIAELVKNVAAKIQNKAIQSK